MDRRSEWVQVGETNYCGGKTLTLRTKLLEVVQIMYHGQVAFQHQGRVLDERRTAAKGPQFGYNSARGDDDAFGNKP